MNINISMSMTTSKLLLYAPEAPYSCQGHPVLEGGLGGKGNKHISEMQSFQPRALA